MVFTTRKLKTCLPSLKSAFSNELKSRVVYKVSSMDALPSMRGKVYRHMTTRIEEGKKTDSQVGLQLQQCSLEGQSADLI